MNSSCEEIGPLVEAFLDGLLSADEAALVDAHLAVCEACAATPSAEFADLLEDYGCQPDVVASAGRWRSVLPPRRAPGPRIPSILWAAVAAALLVGIGLAAFQSVGGSPSDPQQPRGEVYGSSSPHGAYLSPAAEVVSRTERGPSVTILSEGDVRLEPEDESK
ncbi:MAG TPA: hypothetical protein DEA08_29995 [Planctomycetes bacterium]|nr:hypothetical protein [Planctomycetota bacterium]